MKKLLFKHALIKNMFYELIFILKHLEMHELHECILSNVVTDALVLKHQAISAHSAD